MPDCSRFTFSYSEIGGWSPHTNSSYIGANDIARVGTFVNIHVQILTLNEVEVSCWGWVQLTNLVFQAFLLKGSFTA